MQISGHFQFFTQLKKVAYKSWGEELQFWDGNTSRPGCKKKKGVRTLPLFLLFFITCRAEEFLLRLRKYTEILVNCVIHSK